MGQFLTPPNWFLIGDGEKQWKVRLNLYTALLAALCLMIIGYVVSNVLLELGNCINE